MKPNQKVCLYCERDSQAVPLISLDYQDQLVWICPQHFPIFCEGDETLDCILSPRIDTRKIRPLLL